MKTVGPRRMTSEAAAATAERINASMDQVNLSDDENSPQRRANIRGKHFSEKLVFCSSILGWQLSYLSIWIDSKLVVWTLLAVLTYLKDTEPLYHSFMYSLVSPFF